MVIAHSTLKKPYRRVRRFFPAGSIDWKNNTSSTRRSHDSNTVEKYHTTGYSLKMTKILEKGDVTLAIYHLIKAARLRIKKARPWIRC
ncbi:MAG TPA: hypothetical protein VE643_02610 [Nitrososphaeraceae archaeon]|nr:hypothetical protein [Nitrososphaeraceae archaeon]